MLRVLEPAPHATRLQQLGERYESEARFMQSALQNLQAQLDVRQRHDEELAIARDELTTEISHVRMAIDGAYEELTDCVGSDCPTAPKHADDCRRLGA